MTTQAGSCTILHVTTNSPPVETPIQRFRMPLDAWLAFGAICQREEVPRARKLFDLMWTYVKRHGTDEEKAVFIAADRQLRQRRSRKRVDA